MSWPLASRCRSSGGWREGEPRSSRRAKEPRSSRRRLTLPVRAVMSSNYKVTVYICTCWLSVVTYLQAALCLRAATCLRACVQAVTCMLAITCTADKTSSQTTIQTYQTNDTSKNLIADTQICPSVQHTANNVSILKWILQSSCAVLKLNNHLVVFTYM